MSEYIDECKRKATTLVMREHASTMIAAYVVKAKGSVEQARRILEFMDSFGHDKVSLKSDNEDAIQVLRDEIIHLRKAQIVPAGSVPYHLETHGVAEKVVQDVIAQLRKCKMAIESRIKMNISVDEPIIEWMVEHAARTINCHMVGHDGKVPYRRAKYLDPFPTQVEFGEWVLAKHSRLDKKSARKGPLMKRAVLGTWVGTYEPTSENIVIIEIGVAIRTRTIFRRPVNERWNVEVVVKIKSTPLKFDPSKDDTKIPIFKELNHEVENDQSEDESTSEMGTHGDHVNINEGAASIPMRRRFKITKDLLEQHGHIDNCKGCEASLKGFDRREHSHGCRRRLSESMGKIEKGRKAFERERIRLSTRQDKEDEEEEAEVVDEEDVIEQSIANIMNSTLKILCNLEELHKIFEKLSGERIEKGCYDELSHDSEAKSDVSEVYSPPRMTRYATRYGLKVGSALDLITQDDDGRNWDFSFQEMRSFARKRLASENLECIIVCPMCGPFSQLQNLKYRKMDVKDVEHKFRVAVRHLMLAMEICKWQSQRGKMFVFEHFATATPWKLQIIRDVMKLDNTVVVEFDFCYYDMTIGRFGDKHLVKKRTSIMTNSRRIAQRFRRAQCSKEHEHSHLINYKAKACEVYPPKFCQDVCLGIKEEINDRLSGKTSVDKELLPLIMNAIDDKGKSPHDDIENVEWLYVGKEFDDDITGEYFNKARAIEARKLEIDFFKKMKVYSKVPRQQAKEMKAKVITTRWIDVYKGDKENIDYRSRLVGREIKRDQRFDLFAATPPLESFKMIVSICASNQSQANPYRIMTADIKRAYFSAKARRPIFIEIPVEDQEEGDEHRVGKLNFSLHGTRDAAQNWQAECIDHLVMH